ncbi:MAG TPA: ribosome biogenesis factor YjgA [Woeseiaceae bacterium]|nr:ribosome biogenesis factor YjgA [Woeseiaceae bacterium]
MTDSKPSKSERKRTQHALQSLGEQLLGLPGPLLAELDLDESLQKAIQDLGRMKSHEAIRRQKQYIGKLMRDVDPAPIQALLERERADDRHSKRLFANAEKWRDRVQKEGLSAVQALATEIGQPCNELARLVRELEHAHSDRTESTLQRRIFREIHTMLVGKAADR